MTRKDEIPQLPRWKRVMFSVAPTIVILLVIVGIEVALRLTPPPAEEALATEVSFDGTVWLQSNRAWLARFFPSNAAVVPEFKTFLFRKEKLPHTFRVICLGSSSMFGTPYDMNANIPGILRRQLRHRYPALEWEVLNFGASAINSNVVRDLAPELLAFKPDLVLIYMGHNEYYGPDGIGASWLERIFPSLTPLKYKARRLRTVQAVQRWFASLPSGQDAPRNLMQQVSAGHHVELASTESERVLGHFGENLDAILSTFDDAHVPVIVSDIASNLTFPPFVTDSTIGARNAAVFDAQMRGLASEGKFDAVLQEVDGLGGSAARHPLVMYWKGMALRSLGHPTEALPLLIDARDNDLLKFRAPSAIDSIIHAVAQRHGTSCISADTLLRQASPDGIAGDNLFWEHLHPTPAGYYCIASGFLDAIARSGVVKAASASVPVIPFNPDSLHVCWLDLAYGDLSIQHLTGRWPFENYERKPLVLGQADPRLLDLVRDTHARTLAWNDACYRSATMFWRMGLLDDALTTYLAMLEEYPYSFYTNYLAGSLLNTMRRGDEAVGYLRASIRSNPEYLPARLDLGLLAVNAGRYEEGEEQLRYVVQHTRDTPDDLRMKANALYGLGAGAFNRGDGAAAMQAVTQALAIAPGYPDALRLQAAIRGKAPGAR